MFRGDESRRRRGSDVDVRPRLRRGSSVETSAHPRFVAIKDDVINAGAEWVDAAVVVDGPLISSRTPDDLVPFVQALITAIAP